jgi:hypothetical protein
MNPLGKRIKSNNTYGQTVPSERAFDTNSDYSSSLSIPKSEPAASSSRGPTGRDEMVQDNIRRARRKK